MSYEIVRGISIKKDKVFTRMCSNNEYPKDFSSQENPYLSKIFKDKGTLALFTFLIEGGLEGNIHFNRYGNKIVQQLHYVVNQIYNDKIYQNKRTKESELLCKLWRTQEGSKEKELLNKEYEKNHSELKEYIKIRVNEFYYQKIKIPDSIKKELDNVLEMYEENLENDDLDVFSGTQDSYANEMLSQDIYNVLSRDNVEKIISLNNNLYIFLKLNFLNKSYDDVLQDVTDKLGEKIEKNIHYLDDLIDVIQDEKEMEKNNEHSIS